MYLQNWSHLLCFLPFTNEFGPILDLRHSPFTYRKKCKLSNLHIHEYQFNVKDYRISLKIPCLDIHEYANYDYHLLDNERAMSKL